MRSEAEVKEQIEKLKRELRSTKARFARYDNHEDMQAIPQIEESIAWLKWMLD